MATIDDMLNKNDKDFQNIELEVTLRNIVISEEKGKVTLIFYAPSVKSEYRKSYLINDVKGRVDFNRAMFALGSTKNNYGRWLDRIMNLEIPIKISITQNGFVRYIKVLEKITKEYVAKSLFLDRIEGLSEADRKFLMTLTLDVLKKEFGH